MSPFELHQVTHEELVKVLWEITPFVNTGFYGDCQVLLQETEQQVAGGGAENFCLNVFGVNGSIPAAGNKHPSSNYHENSCGNDQDHILGKLGHSPDSLKPFNNSNLKQELLGHEYHDNARPQQDLSVPHHIRSIGWSVNQENNQSASDDKHSEIHAHLSFKSSPPPTAIENPSFSDAVGTQKKYKEMPSPSNMEYHTPNNVLPMNDRIVNHVQINTKTDHDPGVMSNSGSENYNSDSLTTPDIPRIVSTSETDDRMWQPQQSSPRYLPNSGVSNDIADHILIKDAAETQRPRHPQTLPVITADDIKKKDLELNVNETFMRSNDHYDPLLLYHSRLYLSDTPSISQLIDVRFVFSAHHIPRGTDFGNLVGHLRSHCIVDTYMIPHESTQVYEDQDIVFGMTGTFEHVRRGLHDFIRSIFPRPAKFTLWRLCLLVPRTILQSLIGSHEDVSITEYAPKRSIESSLPILRRALARVYGPIRGGKQEHLLTLESCSFTTIINSVYFVAKILGEHNISQDSYQGYYRGGRRSVIPNDMKVIWGNGYSRTELDSKVPAGYVLQPGIKFNLREMHWRKYHFQFHLEEGQLEMIAGEGGAVIREICKNLKVGISISDPMPHLGIHYRRCDVGGQELESISNVTMEIADWFNAMSSTRERQITAFIPQRVLVVIKERYNTNIKTGEYKLSEPEEDRIRLEPDEEEHIFVISCKDRATLQDGIDTLLEVMYDKPVTRNFQIQ